MIRAPLSYCVNQLSINEFVGSFIFGTVVTMIETSKNEYFLRSKRNDADACKETGIILFSKTKKDFCVTPLGSFEIRQIWPKNIMY